MKSVKTPNARKQDHIDTFERRLYLGRDLGLGIGDLDAELLGTGNDVDALA